MKPIRSGEGPRYPGSIVLPTCAAPQLPALAGKQGDPLARSLRIRVARRRTGCYGDPQATTNGAHLFLQSGDTPVALC